MVVEEGVVEHARERWGFIRPDAGGRANVFLHQNVLPAGVVIRPGLRVRYQLSVTPKGPRAEAPIEVLS